MVETKVHGSTQEVGGARRGYCEIDVRGSEGRDVRRFPAFLARLAPALYSSVTVLGCVLLLAWVVGWMTAETIQRARRDDDAKPERGRGDRRCGMESRESGVFDSDKLEASSLRSQSAAPSWPGS
jgi:hypothetical protein